MIIYKYMGNKEKIESGSTEVAELKESIHETQAQMEFLADSIEKTKNDISVKQDEKKRDEQGAILELSEELNEKNKKLKLLEQQNKNYRDNIKREGKELKHKEKECANLTKAIKAKNNEFVECDSKYKEVNERYKYLVNRVDSLESQQLGIGMDDEKRDSGSLAKQLMEAKRLKSEFKSKITNIQNQSKNIKKELVKLNKQRVEHEKNNNKLQNELKIKEAQLSQLRSSNNNSNAMDVDGDDEDDDEEMQDEEEFDESQINQKKEQLYRVRNELEQLQREAARFKFDYVEPFRGFNQKNKVYGKLAKLFRVPDTRNCRAIEICAGGRLFNVVVDTNQTAASLLNHGQLRHRVTIIPLNKIASNCISQTVVDRAKQIVGDEHCNLALDLIGYEDELEKAMKYVFGNAFICSDMNSAKQVAFDPNIRCKAVTIDGEVFNPQGLLTGGSDHRGPSILTNLQLFSAKREEYSRLEAEIAALQSKWNEFNARNQQKMEKLKKIELLQHELKVIADRINDSAYNSLSERIKSLENELDLLQNENLKDLKAKLAVTETKCKDLKQDIQNYEANKQNQAQHVKKQLAECKKEIKKLEKALKSSTTNKNRFNEEIEDLKEEYDSIQDQMEAIKKSIEEYKAKISKIEDEIKSIKSEKIKIDKKLKIERQKINEQDVELKKLQKIVSKNEKEYGQMDLNCSKLQNELKNLSETIKNSKKQIDRMLTSYDWLRQEAMDEAAMREQYDLSEENLSSIASKSAALKEQQSALNNKINHKVMSMFERAENEYRDLIKKREIIRNDKKKIESVIRELDKKKEDTLESTYKKVNEHFGNIFSKLLPGTQCKLEKMKKNENGEDEDEEEEASILDGLEVKVAFTSKDNDKKIIWKESLSELSGGQRSLLALSLILSLLLFKPAPLYILDEIDAALDLSHTQNIGILISKYFAKSQFIVVSLKEGMFTNANVVFRTSFIDGVSAVKRSVGSKLPMNQEKENRNNRNRHNNSNR